MTTGGNEHCHLKRRPPEHLVACPGKHGQQRNRGGAQFKGVVQGACRIVRMLDQPVKAEQVDQERPIDRKAGPGQSTGVPQQKPASLIYS